MIVVTGGAGFIGSCFVEKLNQEGIEDIIIVDNLGEDEKWKNLRGKKFADYYEKEVFLDMIQTDSVPATIREIYHIGACSATTEMDASYLVYNNFDYTKQLAEYAFARNIYFMYASSAATYGDGKQGYSDDESMLDALRPLNMYGFSKHMFDLWLLRNKLLDKAVGLKYFNVFGPNEYHKGDMKSLVCKAYYQIKETGTLRLFKSYHPDYGDGEQKRDFVYSKDVVDIMFALSRKKNIRGIFNLGAGKAETWNALASAVFHGMSMPVNIQYIDMPEQIRSQYQYFTEADMSKLRKAGIVHTYRSLDESVKDYVQNYLMQEDIYL